MKTTQILLAAILASTLGLANAEEQNDNEKLIDDAIAACDAKFNDEDYNDEKQRNQLYDECVDNMISKAPAKTAPKAASEAS